MALFFPTSNILKCNIGPKKPSHPSQQAEILRALSLYHPRPRVKRQRGRPRKEEEDLDVAQNIVSVIFKFEFSLSLRALEMYEQPLREVFHSHTYCEHHEEPHHISISECYAMCFIYTLVELGSGQRDGVDMADRLTAGADRER